MLSGEANADPVVAKVMRLVIQALVTVPFRAPPDAAMAWPKKL